MRVIVVGSGAGGATVARELTAKGFEVLVLEAGREFKPFSRRLSWIEPLRKMGLLGSEKIITRFFPHLDLVHSGGDLVLIRGITTGGTTVLSCGNMVRAEHGLNGIGLDLTPEFEELENIIGVQPFPQEKWRPLTRRMFETAKQLGLNPQPTPKAVDTLKCTSCGLCELGCASGARWDSRIFLKEALTKGAELQTLSPVQKVIIENGEIQGVLVGSGNSSKTIKGDIVILAAGGIGTAQILKASGLKAEDHLWSDIVITLGSVAQGANQLLEPPMVWYTKGKDFILSPYLDILSHWFHKPWRNVPIHDRVGVMVKLADAEEGSVSPEGKVNKVITTHDHQRLQEALSQTKELMESAGISGPYVKGLPNAGHLGGTVPLKTADVSSMKPSWLPKGLWVADLSLVPRSQGLPTILTTAAIALRVSRKIVEES